ncbi:Os04g0360401 [Oryza sativa Japonica Group]|uniref:Os04g0360401 protein n=1 Tax=Oryza sativa subsp. japonica TaxID=39947 RepID=A0A0P0W9E8_ORYSJ|nr:Os04g0360401 [Oryza sativa Japonica Group]
MAAQNWLRHQPPVNLRAESDQSGGSPRETAQPPLADIVFTCRGLLQCLRGMEAKQNLLFEVKQFSSMSSLIVSTRTSMS